MFGKKRKKEQEVKTFFNEQWKEEELIGEGSYGKVYKAKKEECGNYTYMDLEKAKESSQFFIDSNWEHEYHLL